MLMVPANVVKRLQKNTNGGKEMQIKLSKSIIRKQEGSGIFSSLLPVPKSVASTIGKTLGLSALAGAASEGASQIIKNIIGGQFFQVPNQKLYMLAQLSHLLNKGQLNDLANAHNLGRDLLFKITQKQVGNGIGTILASIGIPLVLDALKGRGAPRMGRGKRGGAAVRIGAPPPFLGSWGKGGKGKGLLLGKNSPFNNIPLVGAILSNFIKKIPMSDFDLLEWAQYLKIPLKNVLSRDQKVPHNHQLGLFIYNLEPAYMSGSHWVATYVKDNVINYFESFGMPPSQEMVDHAKKKNLTLLHQNSQIQNLMSSTCGYFCLYFLNEMHQGNDYFDLLQVFGFDTDKNELFIEKYFKALEI